jgi:hypothetical protein
MLRRKAILILLPLVGILLLFSYSMTAFLHPELFKFGRPMKGLGTARRHAQGDPVLYVTDGILDCGGPLIADQCSLRPVSYSTSYTRQAFDVAETLLLGEQYRNYLPSYYYDFQIPFTTTLVLSATYRLTLTPTPRYNISVATDQYTPSIYPTNVPNPTDPTRITARSPYKGIQTQPSDGDNPCTEQRPSDDSKPNSLIDVCHWLANTKQYFVSLRPRADSAYLPSWPGYISQMFISSLNVLGIVLSFRNSLMVRIKLLAKQQGQESIHMSFYFLILSVPYWEYFA